MIYNFTINPGDVMQESAVEISAEGYLPYTGVYVGCGSYLLNTKVDNAIEFEVSKGKLLSNFQVGRFNSIAEGLQVVLGRNHNLCRVDSGALDLVLQKENITVAESVPSRFDQKGTVVIQNDVWIGGDVTIMAGVTVHNGAVIARNSHVVSDVPAYAVVGGNPAKVIGYRFTEEIREKLLKIQWWNWDLKKIYAHASYFTEDLEKFCDRFYPEAEKEYKKICAAEKEDAYFAFVDFYENYCSYPSILEAFLDQYLTDPDKKLVLFIQDGTPEGEIGAEVLNNITELAQEIVQDDQIQCQLELYKGFRCEAEEIFYRCGHYILSRTYWAADFSSLADLYGIDVIAGCDSQIPFEKTKNIYR